MSEQGNDPQHYAYKNPQDMTATEARLSTTYWRAKYEEVRQSQLNIQTDLDAVLDYMHEERIHREAHAGEKSQG